MGLLFLFVNVVPFPARAEAMEINLSSYNKERSVRSVQYKTAQDSSDVNAVMCHHLTLI